MATLNSIKSKLTGREARMFARNTVASIAVFVLDVGILALLVEVVGLNWFPSAAIAFLIAITIHYTLAQAWIFPGSDRGITKGYAYFLINAGIGLIITLAVMSALVEWLHLHYLVARIISSVVAGIAVFFLNAVFNFKEIGH